MDHECTLNYSIYRSSRSVVRSIDNENIEKNPDKLRRDGIAALRNMNNGFGKVEAVVGPHRRKKMCCEDIEKLRERADSEFKEKYSYLPFAVRMVRIFNERRPRSYLTRLRWDIHRAIRLPSPKLVEAYTLKYMDSYTRRRIPVKPHQIEKLREFETAYKDELDKYNHIQKGIDQEDLIKKCRNPRHQRLSGCPNCGVVIMGPNGAKVNYVKAIDRLTKMESLVLLSTHVIELRKELIVQAVALKRESNALEQYRDIIKLEVVRRIQFWWYLRHSRHKVTRTNTAIEKSLFFYRVRKLVFMKMMVDDMQDRNVPIDSVMVLEKYPEYKKEVLEYIKHAITAKSVRLHKFAKRFVANCRVGIMATRKAAKHKREMEEKAQKYFEYMEAKKKTDEEEDENLAACQSKLTEVDRRIMHKMKIQFKTRIDHIFHRKFVCMRPECNRREFLSEDRYNTHMKAIHFGKSDAEKKIFQEKCKGKKALRDQAAVMAIERVRKSRAILEQYNPENNVNKDLLNPVTKPDFYTFIQAPPPSTTNTPRSLFAMQQRLVEGKSGDADSTVSNEQSELDQKELAESIMAHRTVSAPVNAAYGLSQLEFDELMDNHALALANAAADADESVSSAGAMSPGSGGGGVLAPGISAAGTGMNSPSTSPGKLSRKNNLKVVNNYEFSCPSFSKNLVIAPLEKIHTKMLTQEIENAELAKQKKQAAKAAEDGRLFSQQLLEKLSECMSTSQMQQIYTGFHSSFNRPLYPPLGSAHTSGGGGSRSATAGGSAAGAGGGGTNGFNPQNSLASDFDLVDGISVGVGGGGAIVAHGSRLGTGTEVLEPEGNLGLSEFHYLKKIPLAKPSALPWTQLSDKDGEDHTRPRTPSKYVALFDSKKAPTYAMSNPYLSSTNNNTLARVQYVQNYGKPDIYHMELVSQREGIIAPMKIPLNTPIVRLGMLDSACGDSTIQCVNGNNDRIMVRDTEHAMKRSFPLISRIHCIINCPMFDPSIADPSLSSLSAAPMENTGSLGSFQGGIGSFLTDSVTSLPESKPNTAQLAKQKKSATHCNVVDNHTYGGTFIVSSNGVRKVPTKTSSGVYLEPGDLLCIGVGKTSSTSAEISPTDASKACVVYKIRCVEVETKH